MTIAERIADTFTQTLNLKSLSTLDCQILHAIKSVAVRQWAIDTLKKERGI